VSWARVAGVRRLELPPHGGTEIALWFVVSISASVCEETVFRGYLQQQISGWTGNEFIGLFSLAAIFDLCHAYQGWKKTVLIFVWGCVFGAFVWWRKGLGSNMIAHAVSDSLAAF
jgi:membrane protease YdiL (CAAX protease family)